MFILCLFGASHWAVWYSLSVVDRAFGKWPEHRLLRLRCYVASSLHPGRYFCGTSSRLRPLPSRCCPFHCSPTILPKKQCPIRTASYRKWEEEFQSLLEKPNMISVVWDVRPYSLLYGNVRFEENCCFHLQGRSFIVKLRRKRLFLHHPPGYTAPLTRRL